MNDLDICKRIATIEGVKIDALGGKAILDEILGGIRVRLTEYNPLTDDALCFQLMVKYKVDLFSGAVFEGGGAYAVSIAQADSKHGSTSEAHDISANKAICLVIIEAHKEQ